MAKLLKSLLALCLAALLLFACAACGKNPDPPTEPATSEVTTTEPETIDTMATTGVDETTEEPTTAEAATEAPSTTPGQTTGATTTAAPTTAETAKKPGTTAEIVEYFNTSANKVKTDKPGYTWKERTHIDKEKIWISSGLLNSIAPTLVSWAEGSFSAWTNPPPIAKNADHKDFLVPGQSWASKLTASMVKSASCTESGKDYKIKIVLNDEKMSELPAAPASTNHGKVMKIMTKSDFEKGTENIPILKITRFAPDYSNSYIECTIDKATGNMKSITSMSNFIANLGVNLGNTEATVPIGQEAQYTLAY